MAKYRVKIQSDDKIISTDGEISLKKLLNDSGYSFLQHCGEKGKCGVCKVEFIKNPPEMLRQERELFGRGSNMRLSCLHKIDRNCEISLPEKKAFTISKKISGLKIETGKIGYGLAVDLGTTTVAVYFVNLHNGEIIDFESFLNPQSAFGSDVMTRLEKAKDEQSLKKLTESIRDSLKNIIEQKSSDNGIRPDEITAIVVAGNTAMMQFFKGLSGEGLERAPYIGPLEGKGIIRFHPDILGLSENVKCEMMPVLSSFIGGDICAAIIAGEIDILSGNRLLIDFGTNGEIVLSKNADSADRKLFITSTDAGPAFEGEGMNIGMPALEGAIESLDEKGNPLIIGKTGKAEGICGSGYISIISYLRQSGIMDKSGLLKKDGTGKRRWNVNSAGGSITVTQDDIRKFQLAKGAVSAGIRIILGEAQLTIDQLDEIIITGSFGNRIETYAAINTGLIPDIPLKKIRFLDNGAGRGAVIYLASDEVSHRISEILGMVQFISLGEHPDFQDVFIENMTFA